MAEQKNLCYNCFQAREATEAPCPYCGFDLAEGGGPDPGKVHGPAQHCRCHRLL